MGSVWGEYEVLLIEEMDIGARLLSRVRISVRTYVLDPGDRYFRNDRPLTEPSHPPCGGLLTSQRPGPKGRVLDRT
ncbi:hypothetical protein JCM9957A_26560 [Kineosporia succinea]